MSLRSWSYILFTWVLSMIKRSKIACNILWFLISAMIFISSFHLYKGEKYMWLRSKLSWVILRVGGVGERKNTWCSPLVKSLLTHPYSFRFHPAKADSSKYSVHPETDSNVPPQHGHSRSQSITWVVLSVPGFFLSLNPWGLSCEQIFILVNRYICSVRSLPNKAFPKRSPKQHHELN